MSLKERLNELFSRMRPWVLSGAIGATGGILFYMWAQFPLEKLVANVYFSALLTVSLAILLAFALMSAFALTKLGRVAWKKKFVHRGLLIGGVVSSVATLAVYATITGWEPIRSLFGLPQGNLFITSGVVGWIYTFLLTVIFVCMADFEKARVRLRSAMTAEAQLPQRKQTVQPLVTVADPPEEWDVDVTPAMGMSHTDREEAEKNFANFASSFEGNRDT